MKHWLVVAFLCAATMAVILACGSSPSEGPPGTDGGTDARQDVHASDAPDDSTMSFPEAGGDSGGQPMDAMTDSTSAADATDSSSNPDVVASDANLDAGSEAGPGACPATAPTSGDPCPVQVGPNPLECSYGDDPRWGCRMGLLCNQTTHQWSAVLDPSNCPPSIDCPTANPVTYDAGYAGVPCPLSLGGNTCVYGGVAETCAPCENTLCLSVDGGADWHWFVTPLNSGCPSTLPNWGTTCPSTGLVCNYNMCAADNTGDHRNWIFGNGVYCDDAGLWVEYTSQYDGAVACP